MRDLDLSSINTPESCIFVLSTSSVGENVFQKKIATKYDAWFKFWGSEIKISLTASL